MKKTLIVVCASLLLMTACNPQPQVIAYNVPSSMGGTEQPLNDAAITERVKTAFVNQKLFGKSVSPMTINVETIDGIVYLSGTANSKNEVRNAIKIAKSISGVRGVDSRIEVIR